MSNLEDAAIQFAETVQTASINRNPTRRDIAPATAGEIKESVVFDRSADVLSDDDEIPLSVLKPAPAERRSPHVQLPDLRFEQSYLKSIGEASDWRGVTYITVKDQVRTSHATLSPFAKLTAGEDPHASGPRYGLDDGGRMVAPLEHGDQIQWANCRSENQEMVVGNQQMAATGHWQTSAHPTK